MKKTTKFELIQFLRAMLATNKHWSERCLARIFDNQTAFEQEANTTNRRNHIGFTQADAKRLSIIYKSSAGKFANMNDEQIDFVMTRIPKYAKQLFNQDYFDRAKLEEIYLKAKTK